MLMSIIMLMNIPSRNPHSWFITQMVSSETNGNVGKDSINPSEAVPGLNKSAFNTTFPVFSQTHTYLWSFFHWDFSAIFRFLIFFLTETLAVARNKQKKINHKNPPMKQKTKINQRPTEKPYNHVLFQKPSAFLCKNQYLDSVVVALVMQTVPGESSPEQEGESTETAGKLPESACTGLGWCGCPGTSLALARSWPVDAGFHSKRITCYRCSLSDSSCLTFLIQCDYNHS